MHGIHCTVWRINVTRFNMRNKTIYKRAIRQAPAEPKDCINTVELYIPDVWFCEAVLNHPVSRYIALQTEKSIILLMILSDHKSPKKVI